MKQTRPTIAETASNAASAGVKKTETLYYGLRQFLFRNTADSQTVAKNTVWLSISNFGGRLIKAVVIIAAARILDPIGWGVVSYAVTLAGFFTFFVDPGVNVILMREGAKKSEEHRVELLSTIFYIKLALIAFAVCFVLFVGPLFSTLPGAKLLLPIAALIIVGDTLREFFSSFIRTKEKMEWEAGIFLFTNICIVAFGFAALLLSPSARVFGWAYAIGTTIGAIAALWVLRDYIGKLFSHFSRELVMPILKSAWPFAITGALGIFLTNADILILSWMRSAYAVGVYSAAVRIIQVLYLFPVIIQYSTLPLLARLAGKNNQRFREVLEQAIVIIFAVSIPLAFGGLVLSTEIMKFVFGAAYVSGGLSLALLMVSMIVDYPGGVISLAIFAYDQQKTLIIASVIGAASNVIFDLLLIPHFGITGSAWATLIAQVLNNAYLWYVMKRINYFSVLPRLKKITGAAIIMTAISGFLLLLHVNIVINILLSVALYCLLLKLFREPLIADLKKMTRPAEIAPVQGKTDTQTQTKAQAQAQTPIENVVQTIAQTAATIAAQMSATPSVRIGADGGANGGAVNKASIAVEVARDFPTIRKGLGERDVLATDDGMLFIFPRPKRYRAWMQGMRFPIDIIWINDTEKSALGRNPENGFEVVGITENIQPSVQASTGEQRLPFYQSPRPARAMLEVNAGFAKKKNIAVGDMVMLDNIHRQFTVMAPEKAGVDKNAWNRFVERNYPAAGAFLETWEWGEFQKALGHRMERYVIMEKNAAKETKENSAEKNQLVAVFIFACYKTPFGLSYGYLPRGPVIDKKFTESETAHFEILLAIKKWAEREVPELAFVRTEPPLAEISPDIAWHGFRKPTYYIQPIYNTLVPLNLTESEILARFHPSTRSNIKRAERRGVTCVMKTTFDDADFAHFFGMIRSTVNRNHGKNAYPDEHYLRTFLSLISANSPDKGGIDDPAKPSLVTFWGMQNGEPAAAHIVIFFGNTGTYLFGASYADKLNSKVETYLHWSAMREAKRRGMRWYDLGGIDERIWPSLTSFKRQFGGEELAYVGNIDIPLRPIPYHLYNFFRKTAKKMRHQG